MKKIENKKKCSICALKCAVWRPGLCDVTQAGISSTGTSSRWGTTADSRCSSLWLHLTATFILRPFWTRGSIRFNRKLKLRYFAGGCKQRAKCATVLEFFFFRIHCARLLHRGLGQRMKLWKQVYYRTGRLIKRSSNLSSPPDYQNGLEKIC